VAWGFDLRKVGTYTRTLQMVNYPLQLNLLRGAGTQMNGKSSRVVKLLSRGLRHRPHLPSQGITTKG